MDASKAVLDHHRQGKENIETEIVSLCLGSAVGRKSLIGQLFENNVVELPLNMYSKQLRCFIARPPPFFFFFPEKHSFFNWGCYFIRRSQLGFADLPPVPPLCCRRSIGTISRCIRCMILVRTRAVVSPSGFNLFALRLIFAYPCALFVDVFGLGGPFFCFRLHG